MIPAWQRSDRVLLGLSVLVCLLSSAVVLTFSPFEIPDEGYHYYIAERLLQGDVLFRDITVDSYLPGAFLPFVAAFKAFGPSVLVGRAAIAIGLAWSGAWGYVAARCVMPRGAAFAFAVLCALLPGPPYKFYVRGLMLPLLACALMRVQGRSAAALYALAGFTGAAWVTRMDAFYVGVALLGGLLVVERGRGWPWRSLVALIIGPATVVTLYLWFTGGAMGFLHKTIDVLRIAGTRSNSSLNLPPPALDTLLQVDRTGIDGWIYFGGLSVAVALIVHLAMRVARARSLFASGVVVAGIVCGWTLLNVPQFFLARPDTYHLLQQFYALAFGAAWLACQLWGEVGPLRLPKRVAVMALALWIGAVLVGRFSIGGRWSPAVMLHEVRFVVDPLGRWYPEHAYDRASRVVDLVAAAVPADRPVIVVPFHPGIAFLAGRRLASSEPYALPIMRATPARLTRYLNDLAETDAPIAVYMQSFSTNGERSGLFENYMPEVHAVLRRQYLTLWTQPNRTVMIRRGTSPIRYTPSGRVSDINALIATQRFEAARQEIARGLVEAPGSPWLYSLLSRLAFITGDTAAFEQATQAALDAISGADHPERLARLRARNVFRVAMTARQRGRHADAKTLFARVVELDPRWAKGRYEYARALMAHGDSDAAQHQLEVLLEQNPSFDAGGLGTEIQRRK